jgi:hypothetical protein
MIVKAKENQNPAAYGASSRVVKLQQYLAGHILDVGPEMLDIAIPW